MLIQLKELAQKGQPVHIVKDLELDSAFAGRKDILNHSPVHTDLHLKHEAGTIEISGTLSVDLELSCSRCLSQVKQTIVLPFKEVFTQKPVDEGGQEFDEDVHLVTEDKVDLEPYVAENVVVGLPYIPLCDEACKGLCPVCGENRNLKDCGCKEDRIDPRLAGLAELFNKE